MTHSAVIEAASWRLATELCRHLPDLTIFETHPGGGQYDCLTLVDTAGIQVAQLNRRGSVHIRGPRAGCFDVWSTLHEQGSLRRWVDKLVPLLGGVGDARLPSTTPRVLTYRVMASALGITPFLANSWECRNGVLDTSGDGGGTRSDWFRFPGCVDHHKPGGHDEADFRAAARYWFVCRDQQPVAALHDSGIAWTRTGEPLHLWDAYLAERRVAPLAWRLIGHELG